MKLDELKKYFTFIVGGGIGLLINIIITYLLTNFAGVWFRAAYAIGLIVNVTFNFLYHRQITFSKKDQSAKRFYKFVPLTLIITGLNYFLVLLFTEVLIFKAAIPITLFQHYYNYLIIIAITGFVSLGNYIANKLWVFK